MKKIFEKLNISDEPFVVEPMRATEHLLSSYSVKNNDNSQNISIDLGVSETSIQLNKTEMTNKAILSSFDNGLILAPPNHMATEKQGFNDALNAKEIETNSFNEIISLSDDSIPKTCITKDYKTTLTIKASDEIEGFHELEHKEFSITDTARVIDNSLHVIEIPTSQKDYVEVKSKEHLHYIINGKRYAAIGELSDNTFKWYLNYDFPNIQEVSTEYNNYPDLNKKNIFSSTQNINLVYAKSELFSNSKKISIKLLPIALDGTPISSIKIDLNQNFVNPIQKKYNFNPMKITGNDYTTIGNTIKTYTDESIVKGIVSLPQSRYIHNISYNGTYSLPLLSSASLKIEDSNLYYIENSTYYRNTLRYKVLPYRYDNREYWINREEINGSVEGYECLWEINGIGGWRNLILTMDDERRVNKGNEIRVESISYRYDCTTGWANTNKSGSYKIYESEVTGYVECSDNHEWGIVESDGDIKFSYDLEYWFTDIRGKTGSFYWRSVKKISYLIVWKNNNKEIIYDKSGELDINVQGFGGICFERDKELKVRVDNGEWINIFSGDEISGLSFNKIEWEYTGNKLIFIKDLSEVYEIESEDIENQGLHYGRIGVITKEGSKSCCNFYRKLGINDETIKDITLNPLFSWAGKEDKYLVDFRVVKENDLLKSEYGKIELGYDLSEIGKREYEYAIDSRGYGINDLGFVEYREYVGNREIEINNGEIIGIYFYDAAGNEFVLTYEIREVKKYTKVVRFFDNDEINWEGSKVVVLYYVNKWSETRFRAELEKYDIKYEEDAIVEINTVLEPLKAYLYDSHNQEIQLPILINGNLIKIDTSELGDDSNVLSKVVVVVKGMIDSKGIICQKFNEIVAERKTYYKPLISIYENMYLPNRIDFENSVVKTIYPNQVKNTTNYVILEEDELCKEKVLSKVWVDTTRKFNSQNNNFKTFVSSSDEMRYWSEWKEFNEEFYLCECGRFFKFKTVTFAIKASNEHINGLVFTFENMNIAKRDLDNEIIYFSPNNELQKNTLYMLRVRAYNGVNYSEWSNLECYKTGTEDLQGEANNLRVVGKKDRQVNNVKFSWNGTQDVLTYDNISILSNEKNTGSVNKPSIKRSGDDLIKGKDYHWIIKDENSKNAKNNFAMNIKPPTPTFDD